MFISYVALGYIKVLFIVLDNNVWNMVKTFHGSSKIIINSKYNRRLNKKKNIKTLNGQMYFKYGSSHSH